MVGPDYKTEANEEIRGSHLLIIKKFIMVIAIPERDLYLKLKSLDVDCYVPKARTYPNQYKEFIKDIKKRI